MLASYSWGKASPKPQECSQERQYIKKTIESGIMKKSKRLKITIGTPSATEWLHRRFAQSLMSLRFPEEAEIDFSQVFGVQLPFARNHIVEDALEKKSDYLFFIDADMVFPPYTLMKLLSHEKKIVNALAFRRIQPHYPCIFEWNEKEKSYETMAYTKGLLEVDATGMACMLINMDVFRKMERPWYYYRDHIFSSDLTFCKNAKKLGYKILVDTDLKIKHIGAHKLIDENYYLHHLSPEAKKKWNEGMRKSIKELAKDKELYKKIKSNVESPGGNSD